MNEIVNPGFATAEISRQLSDLYCLLLQLVVHYHAIAAYCIKYWHLTMTFKVILSYIYIIVRLAQYYKYQNNLQYDPSRLFNIEDNHGTWCLNGEKLKSFLEIISLVRANNCTATVAFSHSS